MNSLEVAIGGLKKAARDLTKIGQLKSAQKVLTYALDLEELENDLSSSVLGLDSKELAAVAADNFNLAVELYRVRLPGIPLPAVKKIVTKAVMGGAKKPVDKIEPHHTDLPAADPLPPPSEE